MSRHQIHDSLSKISSTDLQQAYLKCFNTLSLTKTQLLLQGFKLIHQSTQENFLLYKKKIKEKVSTKYRVIYLMIGEFSDISPRSFLTAQFDPLLRRHWDITCKEMQTEGVDKISHLIKGEKESCDQIYYRTRWPWPLKDRDYVLARRVRHFNDKNALVLISKSTDSKSYPKVDNVIRVDRYWCQSVVFATKGSVDKQGMKFVTFFCDDQQMQLPNKLIDLLCKAGERVVPESMASLHRVAQSTNNNT